MKYSYILGIFLFASAAVLSGANDPQTAQEKAELNKQCADYSRTQNYPELAKVRKQLLDLASGDDERMNALYELGALYTHSIRDLKTGAEYFGQAVELMKKKAESQPPEKKAASLERIGWVYQIQLRKKTEAMDAYRAAAQIYSGLADKASGREKIILMSKHRNMLQLMEDKAGMAESSEKILSAWKAYLKENESLPPAEWRKTVNPETAINSFSGDPRELELAYAVADKAIAMDDATPRERYLIANSARNAAYRGQDFENAFRYLKTMTECEPGNGALMLQLGEGYFRTKRDLANARKTFEIIRDGAQFDANSREKAVLWLEMLSD